MMSACVVTQGMDHNLSFNKETHPTDPGSNFLQ